MVGSNVQNTQTVIRRIADLVYERQISDNAAEDILKAGGRLMVVPERCERGSGGVKAQPHPCITTPHVSRRVLLLEERQSRISSLNPPRVDFSRRRVKKTVPLSSHASV
jgi:hypothetical protein